MVDQLRTGWKLLDCQPPAATGSIDWSAATRVATITAPHQPQPDRPDAANASGAVLDRQPEQPQLAISQDQ